ncbi:hypothetical protein [Bradyrhizobium sp. th.b2]|uniref:hypothetical protein n=1 Tax=Bradyrhizobium sp. th-b2 TaxID=172088 RepID=UPI00048A8475|nr:hypothetical protein [Bradyrhizobium sp. th.b2]
MPKQVPAEFSGQSKDAIALCFEGIGSLPQFIKWAQKHRAAFYSMYTKLIPVTVSGTVVISKRYDDEPLCNCAACSGFRNEGAVSRYASGGTPHQKRLRALFGSIDFRKAKFAAPPNDPDDDEHDEEDNENNTDNETDETEQGQLPPKLEAMIAAVIAASPNSMSRQEAINYLLHSRHGRELARHMATFKRKDEPIMDRATELQSIVKQHGGLMAMAKLFIANGESLGGVTEAEFTKLIDAEAQATRKTGERPAPAFDRFFNDPTNLELRKAHRLTRGF